MNKIFTGDCREILPTLDSESVDLAVTSPPYWGLRDYGTGEDQLGLEPHPQLFIDHLVEISREVKRVLKPRGSFWLNLGDSYCSTSGGPAANDKSSLGEKTKAAQRRAYYLGEKSNWLQPKQKLMIPERTAIALQDDGWILRNSVIWYKPNHMPESVRDRLTKSYEFFFFFVKSRKYYFNLDPIREAYSEVSIARLSQPSILSQMGGDKQEALYGDAPGNGNRPADILKGIALRMGARSPNTTRPEYKLNNPRANAYKKAEELTKHEVATGRIGNFSYDDPLHNKANHPNGKNPGDMWSINTQPFPGSHFAVFPDELVEKIIKCSSPKKGVVLDPFAGSGTTLRVARRLGRQFIGIELNPEYAEMCEHRVRTDNYQPPPANVPKLKEFAHSSSFVTEGEK